MEEIATDPSSDEQTLNQTKTKQVNMIRKRHTHTVNP